MKIEYSRPGSTPNFGDDLNEWLWDAMAPGLLDNEPGSILLGMGTIFSRWFTDRLPSEVPKILIGSGGGKAGGIPDLKENWIVYGVRGPLTAAYSGLPSEMVLTDPAMALHRLSPLANNRTGVGFMPHIWSEDEWNWEAMCEELGITYISPTADAKAVISSIGQVERLITEAMHGAIVADALRTPWIPVQISPRFEPSKWSDWAGSLRLPVLFERIPELRGRIKSPPKARARSVLKSTLQEFGFRLPNVYRQPSRCWEIQEARAKLRSLSMQTLLHLSDEGALNTALDRFEGALRRLVTDKSLGRFA